MSGLPRIPNPAGPVVIPAVAERDYPDLFFTQFLASVPPDAETFLAIRTRPYSFDKKELHPDESLETVHREENVWALAGTYPVVAQAMGAVIQAGTLLIALRAAQGPLAAAQAALDAATAELTDAITATTESNAAVAAAEADSAALPQDADEATRQAAANALATAQATATAAAANQTTKQTTKDAALAARDQAAAVVTAIETQLGKQG